MFLGMNFVFLGGENASFFDVCGRAKKGQKCPVFSILIKRLVVF
jgi:hypothetical protein